MTLIQDLLSQSKHGQQELARQELIVSVTEQIWAALEEAGMTKADLARTLEKSKSHVTQLLGGQRNMTLSTLADISEAIGVKPHVVLMNLHHQPVMPEMHVHWRPAVAAASAAGMKPYTAQASMPSLVTQAIAGTIQRNHLFDLEDA